jgi:hypothetical protein
MSTMALRSVLKEVIPDFEKQAGVTVEIKYGATAKLIERIRTGARDSGAIQPPMSSSNGACRARPPTEAAAR